MPMNHKFKPSFIKLICPFLSTQHKRHATHALRLLTAATTTTGDQSHGGLLCDVRWGEVCVVCVVHLAFHVPSARQDPPCWKTLSDCLYPEYLLLGLA